MLYLHCGSPRTGTTSVQAALFRNRGRLATAGVRYPDLWRASVANPAHHGLYDLLDASLESESALNAFKRFLTASRNENVLLSAEALTNWLLSDDKKEAFLKLLGMAQEMMPTTCIWTLRRDDETLSSMYLLALEMGFELPPAAECVKDVRHPNGAFDVRSPDDLFDGMSRIDELLNNAVIYLKYDSDGAHNCDLLEACGISGRVKTVILKELEDRPRLNTSLSHKQAVALINFYAISTRIGVRVGRSALKNAFRAGDFRFKNDRPCELLDGSVRRELHERALAASRRRGFAPYVEFFASSEFADSGSVDIGLDALTDEDLERLAFHFSGERLSVRS